MNHKILPLHEDGKEISISPLTDVSTYKSHLEKYQAHLKHASSILPEISMQGWFDNNVPKQFINITLVKLLAEEGHEHSAKEYSSSTQQMIEDEVVYGTQQYVNYDHIFRAECNNYMSVILI